MGSSHCFHRFMRKGNLQMVRRNRLGENGKSYFPAQTKVNQLKSLRPYVAVAVQSLNS
jgi:hypothetical protein